MNQLTTISPIESALIQGDLSKLTNDQRLSYFKSVCESLGLNPLTKPFDFINLNGKLTLYAKRDATDQLRRVHGVSITITSREKIDDIYIVTAKAKDKSGREDESTGAVNVAGLKGDALANAFLKSETKAKRRVTLSICGLGMLDESEADSIPEIKEAIQELPKQIAQEKKVKKEIIPGDFICTFGKFKGQMIRDVDPYELNSYCHYIKEQAEQTGKAIQGKVKEFLDTAELYLSSLEVDNVDQDFPL